jgi:hypothetical protein
MAEKIVAYNPSTQTTKNYVILYVETDDFDQMVDKGDYSKDTLPLPQILLFK